MCIYIHIITYIIYIYICIYIYTIYIYIIYIYIIYIYTSYIYIYTIYIYHINIYHMYICIYIYTFLYVQVQIKIIHRYGPICNYMQVIASVCKCLWWCAPKTTHSTTLQSRQPQVLQKITTTQVHQRWHQSCIWIFCWWFLTFRLYDNGLLIFFRKPSGREAYWEDNN